MTLIDDSPYRLAEALEVASGEAPPARSLLDVFAATLECSGGRLAIDAPDRVLTYEELWGAAGAVSADLAGLGVGPGDRVGIRVSSGTADLYVAILGVLRAGAAYVPVDADDPPARAGAIWASAGACAVIEDGLLVTSLAPPRGGGLEPRVDDDAWVIFTSGSTGAPKGVAVTHRSAAAFVDAEARLWRVDPEDRVLAGLSVAFDASCEEMWVAWRHGAALVPAPRAIVRAGADLGPWLAQRRATVVSTVPTLASMWDDDVLAGVRLLILGGEACPEELGWRLAAGREVWNTYGPTEATVVSTATRIRRGRPVTIGLPLDGWRTAVVDEDGCPVELGEIGELAIAGVGLGCYLDPTLDANRFAPLPALGWARAYRTGDLVRETVDGFAFVGRRDDQVKLGGRRIELGDVEAQLRAAPGVRGGGGGGAPPRAGGGPRGRPARGGRPPAAALRTTEAGNSLLVGYVVGDADPSEVRGYAAQRLPAGVAPLVVRLDGLPLSASGKVDRKALPWPPPADARATDAGELTATAAWLAERWAEQLGPVPMTADSDFFELGGTSVAAAKLVSSLRGRFPATAVADVYTHRRLANLADRLDSLGEGHHDPEPRRHSSAATRWSLAQVAGVFLLLALTVPGWLEGIFAYNDWQGIGTHVSWVWLVAGWLVLISAPGRMLIAVLARRALLRRLEPGRYPRRGWLACRVWFVDRLAEVLHVDRLAGTPWAPVAARLLGARVGAGARLATLPSPTALISIGDGATLEAGVDAHGWWIEGDELVIGRLRIGAGARIGTRTVLMPGADIGEGAEIEPGSVVSTPVPARERWSGSPARRVGDAGEDWPADAPARERHRRLWASMYGVGSIVLSTAALVAAIPGLLLLELFGAIGHSVASTVTAIVLSAPLVAATFTIGDALVHALLFRAAARLIRPGWHSDTGAAAWALWFCGQITEAAQTSLFPLYATVYTRAWLRLHGLRVGRRTEVSTAEGLNPLVQLGDTSFVADHPMFAAARAHRGWLHLQPIEVGDRTFIGNGALLTAGTTVGSDCLVGIETNAPAEAGDGTSWFGAPPLELPRVPDRPDAARTTDPPRRLVIARGATEIVRILLPSSVSIALGALVLLLLDTVDGRGGAWATVAAAPVVVVAAAACAVLVTIAAKWLIIGRYRSGQNPLWSSLVWRDEIINSCQEQLAGQWLLQKALGTPLVPAYLRAMGAKVGRDVWCDTLAITEFDVVTVGEGSAVNRGACLETHLFHDRLLRIGPTELGASSTLGPVSATLPDTKLGVGCVVGGRSVVLRGEQLPPGSRWHGAPVVGV